MKLKANLLCSGCRVVLFTLCLSSSIVHAGTTWDGGGAVSEINLADNWDGTAPGVVNALNGTTAAIFATGGNAVTMNVPARFTSLTFNRDDAGGFAIGGASTLSVNFTGTGSTMNLSVSDTAGNGVTSITSPLQVYTTGAGATRLLNIKNLEDDAPDGSLLISGGISASTAANTYAIRAGGTGVTVFSGPLSHVSAIQQVNSGTSSGKVMVTGNQSLGAAMVNVPTTPSGTVSSAYTIQMGASTADVQSWASTSINQNAMVSVKSTATLTGGVAIGGAAGATGATMVVDGALSAVNLNLGTAGVTGNLKIGGSTVFSGVVTISATAGNLIVGNAATNGTLSLSSGTISENVTIGGLGENENNLNLTKINAGTLTLGGSHTYAGDTNVNAGTLNLVGTISSPIFVNAGATLGGEGSTSGSLTFTTGNSALQFDPTTETEVLTANTVDVSSAGIVLIHPTSATDPLSTYTVLKRVTGSFVPGDLAKFALASRGGTLSITGASNNEITLTAAEATSASLIWKGADTSNPTFWDVAATLNWDNSGADRFYAEDAVTFNDAASSFNVVVQGASVLPGDIVFDNAANHYTFSSGSIGGSGSLTKNNSGTVTLANSLAHTNGITVNAGILDLGTANNTFTGGVNVAGGELKFGGAALPSTGSLNSQAITLNGGTITRASNSTITNETQTIAIDANGSGIKIDSNANVTWRVGGKVSGAGNWTKSGNGVLALGNNNDAGPGNDFTGTVTVTAGTLDVRHADSLGSSVGGTSIQSAVLLMQNYGQTSDSTITVNEPIEFSGTSFLAGYCQQSSIFTQQFNGVINVQDGTTLGISTARAGTATAPTLELNGTSIITGEGCVLNLGSRPASYPAGSTAAAQTVNIAAAITGPGAVTVQGDAGSVYTLGAPGYSGNTTVNSGTLKLGAVNANNETSTVTIEIGAKIDIAFSENDTVGTLVLGGTTVPGGSYNASHPVYGEYFSATGSGSIVVPGAVGGYSAWQSTNGATGQTVDQDHDNDGVDNGIEYFMGESGSGFTATPALNSSNQISWTMGDSYSGTYGTDYLIQTSSDLNLWTPVAEVDVTIDNSAPGKSVSYTLIGSGKRFVRLLVNPN